LKHQHELQKLKPTIDVHGPFFFMLESTHNDFTAIPTKMIQPMASIQSLNQLKLFWISCNDYQTQ
jgi:hypothetical protein